MPKLKCKVEQCAYNYDWLCRKNYIDVDGPSSRNKKETTCKNYLFKDVDTYKYEFASFVDSPKAITEVYCDAINCVFEKGQKCYADRIEINNVTGETKANYKDGSKKDITYCQTFESKDY